MKLIALALSLVLLQEEFSGPQKGEALPDAKVKVIFGPDQGKEIKLLAKVGDKPSMILFVHEVTRPGVGLVRTVSNYASKRSKDGLQTHVVFLTSDPTETEKWMNRAKRALPKKLNLAISPDGIEGPGSFGLNRKMQITALIAKEKKVVANFAIVSPNIPSDAMKICTTISKMLGDKKAPTQKELGIASRGRQARGNGKFERLMRPFIQKNLDEKRVVELATNIEKEANKDEALKKRIHEVTRRIINAGKLKNYGTPKAQEYLTKWSKSFAPNMDKNKSKTGKLLNKNKGKE